MCVKRTKKNQIKNCVYVVAVFCVINKPKMKFLSLLNTFLLLFNEKNKRNIFATKFIHKKQNFFSFSFLILENKNDKKKFLIKISCKTMRLHYT